MQKSDLKRFLLLLLLLGSAFYWSSTLQAQRTFDDDSIEEPLDSIQNSLPTDTLRGGERAQGDGFLEEDTLDIPLRISQVKYITDLEFGNWQMPDTNLTNQQYYLPTEQPFNHYRRLGGLGLYHYPTYFEPSTSLKFDWGYNNLNQYPIQRRYFQANYPLTKAQYVWGLHNEQYFRVMHTQNLNPFFNLLVDYQVMGAEGLYQHQKTNAQNLVLGTSFQSKNQRYQNHLTYAWNRYKLEENGGVDDFRLDLVRTYNKPLLDVNLANARHDNVDRSIKMWHSYDFGFSKSRKDSVKVKKMVPKILELDNINNINNGSSTPMIDALFGEEPGVDTLTIDSLSISAVDSIEVDSIKVDSMKVDTMKVDTMKVDTMKVDTIMVEVERDSVFMVKDFYPSFRLFHQFEFLNDKHHYGDNSFPIDFYPTIYYDSLQTDDTLTRNHFSNEIGLLFLGSNFFQKDTTDTHLRAKFSLTHEYIRFKTLNTSGGQIEIPQEEENTFLQLKFFNQRKRLQYFLLLEKGLIGWNASGLKAHLQANYEIPFGRIGLEYLSNRSAPSYVYTRIATNHHRWINENLSDISVNKIGLRFSALKGNLELSANQYLVNNYTYFDSTQTVSQLPEQLSVQQFSITGKANKGKWFGQAHLLFQNSNNNQLPIPNLMLTASVWHETKIFNAMWLEIGGLIDYNSNYFTPLFAPSMEQFYWQENEEATFYPNVDLFINARVRTVRFIIRTQNMTQDLFQDPETTYSKGYPMLDRGVKLGLTWWFFD